MKQVYEIRVDFRPHPTQHLLVPVAEVRYTTFSSVETLFSIEGEPGRFSEDDVKELVHRAKYLLYDYVELWREIRDSWTTGTSEFVEVER